MNGVLQIEVQRFACVKQAGLGYEPPGKVGVDPPVPLLVCVRESAA